MKNTIISISQLSIIISPKNVLVPRRASNGIAKILYNYERRKNYELQKNCNYHYGCFISNFK